MKFSDTDEGICKVGAAYKDALNDVKNRMTAQKHITGMSELFKVLGDTTRVSILSALSVSELCVCDIAALLRMSNSAISHQLRILKQTHFVKNRREGKVVYYRMADEHIMQLLDTALKHLWEG